MHGTIVVLTDKRTLQEDEHYLPWADYEMQAWILGGCDYVIRDDPAEFQESLQCLNQAYGLDIRRVVVTIDGGARLEAGVLDRECLRSLMAALREDEKKRLEKILSLIPHISVRRKLGKPELDIINMWQIADIAYMDSKVYFAVVTIDGGPSFQNEMDFYHSMQMQDEAGPLYVVATYRFHV